MYIQFFTYIIIYIFIYIFIQVNFAQGCRIICMFCSSFRSSASSGIRILRFEIRTEGIDPSCRPW